MKKLLIVGLLFSVQHVLPVIIKMPSQEILNVRLSGIGANFFSQKSNIVQELGGKEFELRAFFTILESGFCAAFDNQAAHQDLSKIPMIIEVLLQDYPDVLKDVLSTGSQK